MKNLLCRLGLHPNYYIDSALMSHAMRCNNCGKWQKEKEGKRVEQERILISKNPHLDIEDMRTLIINTMFIKRKK